MIWRCVQGYYSRMTVNTELKNVVNFVHLSDEFPDTIEMLLILFFREGRR